MRKIITIILIAGYSFGIHAVCLSQSLADMPTPRFGTCAVVFNGEIYIMGGRDASGKVTGLVERYNPLTNTWRTEAEELKKERENAAASTFLNTIYVMGGNSDEDEIEKKVEFFDVSEGKWEDVEELEVRRDGLSALVLNDRMYAIGGFGTEDDDDIPAQFLNSTEYYDSGLDKWILDNTWQMNLSRASFTAVIFNESAFILGGFSKNGPMANVESYDPVNGVLNRESLQVARGGFAAVVAKNYIFVLGGRNPADEVLASIEYFDLEKNTWNLSIDMKTPRELFSTVTFQDTIYVFGGLDDDGDLVASVEKIIPDNITSVAASRHILPAGFLLEQNYPNPFNPQTKINFQIPGDGFDEVKLSIYTTTGQLVRRLVQSKLAPAQHAVNWDGLDAKGHAVASGIYLYSLQYGKFRQSRKMLLVR